MGASSKEMRPALVEISSRSAEKLKVVAIKLIGVVAQNRYPLRPVVACAGPERGSAVAEGAELGAEGHVWRPLCKKQIFLANRAPDSSIRFFYGLSHCHVAATERKEIMSKSTKTPVPMTTEAAARIQSGTAKNNRGTVPKGSFASRAQSAAEKNK